MNAGLIVLDRDGVLNAMVVDPEHGTVDSPLHPSSVRLLPGVEDALARLTASGLRVVVATNQPAAAKGKTTRANLDAVHAAVLALAQRAGGVISASYVCHHRAEDGCGCRKPHTGLLEAALAESPGSDRAAAWMVGDGVTDVEAGRRAGMRTAFLAPHRCDVCAVLDGRRISPDYWGPSLADFAAFVCG